jgi:hypothetical protein
VVSVRLCMRKSYGTILLNSNYTRIMGLKIIVFMKICSRNTVRFMDILYVKLKTRETDLARNKHITDIYLVHLNHTDFTALIIIKMRH